MDIVLNHSCKFKIADIFLLMTGLCFEILIVKIYISSSAQRISVSKILN